MYCPLRKMEKDQMVILNKWLLLYYSKKKVSNLNMRLKLIKIIFRGSPKNKFLIAPWLHSTEWLIRCITSSSSLVHKVHSISWPSCPLRNPRTYPVQTATLNCNYSHRPGVIFASSCPLWLCNRVSTFMTHVSWSD